MAISKAFAFNEGANIDGTDQYGSLAVGTTDQDYSLSPGGVTWYEGPDFSLGRVIAGTGILYDEFGIPIPGPQPGPTYIPGPTFWRSTGQSDDSVLALYNAIKDQIGGASVNTAAEAITWLTSNGFYVSDPVVTSAWLVYGRPNGSTNWHYWVISDSGVTGPVDLGVDSNTFTYANYDVANNSAWMLHLTSWGSTQVVNYISTDGTLLNSTERDANNAWWGEAEGTWLYYQEWNSNIFSFAKGSFYHQVNWADAGLDSGYYNYLIDWNYDACSSTALIMRGVAGTTSYFYALSPSTVTENSGLGKILHSWDNSTYNVQQIVAQGGTYILLVTQEVGTNYLVNIKIMDVESGTLLHTVDLSGFNYASWDTSIYGNNKFVFWCYDNNNVNNEYKIWSYNATTDQLNATTHARGATYNWMDLQYQDGINRGYPQWMVSENAAMYFYGNSSWTNENNVYLDQWEYVSILPIMEGDLTFRDPIVLGDGVNQIGTRTWWCSVDDGITFFWLDYADYKYYRRTVVPGVGTQPTTQVLFDSVDGLGTQGTYFGWDNFQNTIVFNDYTRNKVFKINSATGQLADWLQTNYNNWWASGKAFVMQTSAGDWYYANDANAEFILLPNFGNLYGSWSVDEFNTCSYVEPINGQVLNPSRILYWSANGGDARLITEDNIYTLNFSTIDFNNLNQLGLGLTSITFEWYNTDISEYQIDVYGFDGTLLQTSTSGAYSANRDYSVYTQGMDLLVTDDADTAYQVKLVTPNGVQSFLAPSGSGFNYAVPSDYPWSDC